MRQNFRKARDFTAQVFLCAFLSTTFAADQEIAPQPQPQISQPSPAKVSGITQAAVKGGVLSCAGRIEQVSNFLTTNSRSAAVLFIPPSQPDRQLVSASIEIEPKDAPLVYGSASFAPGMANGCGGIYETVIYWPARCEEVASRNFSGLKQSGVISRNIAVLDAGISARVFLMPAGPGCVSIKKELVR